MAALLGISRVIDALNTVIGRIAMWFTLAAVLISTGNAAIRYVLPQYSSNAWLEAQWYLFGAMFMLCAAYTLLKNEHIRIDVVASRWSKRTRDWVDVAGHVIVLIPFCLLMIYELWPFVKGSYLSGEVSNNPGGLIKWPAKALILFGFVLLLLQAISELIKRIAIIRGDIPDSHEEKHEFDDDHIVA